MSANQGKQSPMTFFSHLQTQTAADRQRLFATRVIREALMKDVDGSAVA